MGSDYFHSAPDVFIRLVYEETGFSPHRWLRVLYFGYLSVCRPFRRCFSDRGGPPPPLDGIYRVLRALFTSFRGVFCSSL